MARYVEVTVKSGNGDVVFQTTTFRQNYETKEQQLAEQVPLFKAVAAAVIQVMEEAE